MPGYFHPAQFTDDTNSWVRNDDWPIFTLSADADNGFRNYIEYGHILSGHFESEPHGYLSWVDVWQLWGRVDKSPQGRIYYAHQLSGKADSLRGYFNLSFGQVWNIESRADIITGSVLYGHQLSGKADKVLRGTLSISIGQIWNVIGHLRELRGLLDVELTKVFTLMGSRADTQRGYLDWLDGYLFSLSADADRLYGLLEILDGQQWNLTGTFLKDLRSNYLEHGWTTEADITSASMGAEMRGYLTLILLQRLDSIILEHHRS